MMSWLTIAWSMCAGICFMLGALHILLLAKNPAKGKYLLSALMAFSAGGSAIVELSLMFAESTSIYGNLLQLEYVFVYVLLMSMLCLVSLELGCSQRWMLYLIVVLWSLGLVFNFLSPGSLVYTQVDQLNSFTTFYGQEYTVGSGPDNPWNLLANVGVLLIIVYVIINTIKTWSRGAPRKAVTLGASVVLFILSAGTHSMLVDIGAIRSPYMISFAYLAIVMAMSYELVSQAVQVPQLTREVAAQHKRWQDLLTHIQLAVVAVDTEGRMTYSNPFFQNITGYDQDQLIDKPLKELLPDLEQSILADRFKQAIEQGPRPHSQWRILCASGEIKHFSWSSERQVDNDGKVEGVLSIGYDMTDQLHAQRELGQVQLEMEQMARINILGELASTMAHELNQPLAAILSNAQAARRMLLANKLQQDEFIEILDDIVTDDKRAGEMIHSMRALFSRGEVSKSYISMDACIDQLLRIVNGELTAQKIHFKLNISENLPKLYASSIELQQVIMNLIMNAIHVQENIPEGERYIGLSITADNEAMRFEVHDRGPGIEPEQVSKIFEPFFTQSRNGVGLGLALCRRIVEAHGGDINVENLAQGGANFFFTIPVISDEQAS